MTGRSPVPYAPITTFCPEIVAPEPSVNVSPRRKRISVLLDSMLVALANDFNGLFGDVPLFESLPLAAT
jgi:hypothetical protein